MTLTARLSFTQAGSTPLHYCANKGSADVARLLLQAGADPCAKDQVRERELAATPLSQHWQLTPPRARRVALSASLLCYWYWPRTPGWTHALRRGVQEGRSTHWAAHDPPPPWRRHPRRRAGATPPSGVSRAAGSTWHWQREQRAEYHSSNSAGDTADITHCHVCAPRSRA